ncbi:MAG: hypothetical protein ACFCUV_05380 [Rivularia sp. (in: cyanobacteria)]
MNVDLHGKTVIMPYTQFTNISKAKEAFGLKTQEGGRFIPCIEPIEASATLTAYLKESLPLASGASEKARSFMNYFKSVNSKQLSVNNNLLICSLS